MSNVSVKNFENSTKAIISSVNTMTLGNTNYSFASLFSKVNIITKNINESGTAL